MKEKGYSSLKLSIEITWKTEKNDLPVMHVTVTKTRLSLSLSHCILSAHIKRLSVAL